MLASLKFVVVLAALICCAFGASSNRASAVTVEVARKCQALTVKTFPPREPGNPAAGSASGTGPMQREYFNKCVANGGKVDDTKQ